MIGHPAHWNLAAVVTSPGCQGDSEDPGCLFSVLEKHLIKISETKKEDGIMVY
jgi:hypothetical protein